MENPHNAVPSGERNVGPNEHHSEDYLIRMEGSRHDAWNEGDANGYIRAKAEQAEIVRELVGACEMARALVMIQGADQPELYQSEDFIELKLKLEAAIAKGEK